MKKYTKQLSLCVVLMVVTIMAFGGCGNDGPTGPKNVNVAGTWLFSGRISENSCLVLQDEPGFQIGVSAIEIIDVTQNEVNLTALPRGGNIFGSDDAFSGTVSGNSFALTMVNPLVSTGGRCTFSIGGSMEVNGIKDNSGTGFVRLTTSHQAGNLASSMNTPVVRQDTGCVLSTHFRHVLWNGLKFSQLRLSV